MTNKLRAEKVEGGLLYFDYHQITAWYPGDGVFVVDIPFGENPDNSESIKCKIGTEEWYTGHKDLKDKEIYEGDIIAPYKFKKLSDYRIVVEFYNGMFCLKPNGIFIINREPLYKYLNRANKANNSYIKIGNINQGINKELINANTNT